MSPDSHREMKRRGLAEHAPPLQYAAFRWWPRVERVRQRDKSRAVGTGPNRSFVCREDVAAPVTCPGQLSPGSGAVGRKIRANRSRQAGKNQKRGPWLFSDIFWGRVGMGRDCKSSHQMMGLGRVLGR